MFHDARRIRLVLKCLARGKRVAIDLIKQLCLEDKELLMSRLQAMGRRLWSLLVVATLPMWHSAHYGVTGDESEAVAMIAFGRMPIPTYQ